MSRVFLAMTRSQRPTVPRGWWNGRDAANRHWADWSPSDVSPRETWLLLLMKVDGAVVICVGPVTMAAGRSTEPPARAAVAAAAVDTGAAMAIALRAAGTRHETRPGRLLGKPASHLALRVITWEGLEHLALRSVSGHVSV